VSRLGLTLVQIFLAMEERDPNGVGVAESLIQLLSGKFRAMQYIVHPTGRPGEVPGKSSNVSWAAKQVERKYLNEPNWSSVLVTVMDSECTNFHLTKNAY
jgi:hypothetical protein